uniref:PCI domain-containing protein n=1 Tax=Spongospora subterranea TaxID=70186 RepID=A0A0H5R5H9_9EUKA|eukprot:CRZ09393.1 hypothetical protein [Spongospora subterranea]
MTVFVSVGDSGAELAALLERPAVANASPYEVVSQLLTGECVKDLIADRESHNRLKMACSLAFSMVNGMDIQDVAKFSERIVTMGCEDTNNARIRLYMMTGFFNAISSTSIKARVLLATLKFGLESGNASVLANSLPNTDQWIKDWALDSNSRFQLLNLVAKVYDACGNCDLAQATRIISLQCEVDDESAKSLQSETASEIVAYVLREGQILFLDNLLATLSSRAIGHSPLMELLQLIVSGNFDQLNSFLTTNEALLSEFNLNAEQLRVYMRSLILSTMSLSQNTLLLSSLIEPLSLSSLDEVEQCIIAAVCLGLIDAQIDQDEGSVYISGRVYTSLSKATWKSMQSRLTQMQEQVGTVLPWSQHVQN